MQSLHDFFGSEYGHSPFSHVFLDGRNLRTIQAMLTEEVRLGTGTRDVPVVDLTVDLLSKLIQFAYDMRLVVATTESLQRSNLMFVKMHSDSLVHDANMGKFFRRWCTDGIPDPNNVPLPISAGDSIDMTLDTSSYRLSHPYGMKHRPRF